MSEIWKDVINYEGIYKVSNFGRVKSVRRNKIMKPTKIRSGYLQLDFRKDNLRKKYLVHRVVAIAFVPNPDEKPQINHIDGNKENNSAGNLEWVTGSENTRHAFENLLAKRERPILQFELDGRFVKRWDSATDISKFLNVKNNGCICEVCKGKRKSAYGYLWRFAEA